MAGTAREIMTGGPEWVGLDDSLVAAAQRMVALGVGALPICGDDGRLRGMVTDRDVVVVVARGLDPATATAGVLAQDDPVSVDADDSLHELVRTMGEHRAGRLPVVDGSRLIGVVTEADVAAHAPRDAVIDLVTKVHAGS